MERTWEGAGWLATERSEGRMTLMGETCTVRRAEGRKTGIGRSRSQSLRSSEEAGESRWSEGRQGGGDDGDRGDAARPDSSVGND